MPLEIHGKMARWMAAALRRWYRLLRLQDWTISARAVSRVDMRERAGEAEGCAALNAVYLNGEILLCDDLQPDSEWVAFHELRHAHYAAITHAFDQCWDGRRKMSKAEARRLVNDAVETAIQRDWLVIGKNQK